jgi:hypothetical protein
MHLRDLVESDSPVGFVAGASRRASNGEGVGCVGLEFVFVWFDIGFRMVVNGLISSSIESGTCSSLCIVALILRLQSKRTFMDHTRDTRGAVLTSPSNFMLVLVLSWKRQIKP